MNRSLVLVLVLCFGSLLGCDRLLKERQKVENLLASASAAASAAAAALPPPVAPAPTPTLPTVSDAQIPTPEDFEQQAGREITAQNLQAELDKLKRDIGP